MQPRIWLTKLKKIFLSQAPKLCAQPSSHLLNEQHIPFVSSILSMATSTPLLYLSCFLLTLALSLVNAYSIDNYYNTKKPILNKIDSCWRAKANWATNRKVLADCAIGFGKDAIGGKYGAIYIVTDSSDDPTNPKPGTLFSLLYFTQTRNHLGVGETSY